MKRLLMIMLGMTMLVGGLRAADEVVVDEQTRDSLWQQEDFVKAYLVVAEPGNILYTIFGHACLHLVCESYKLDYFFSYESENVQEKLGYFLLGKLKMGLIRCTPDQYLSVYKEQGRGVKEYELNLPIDIKRRLWMVLDGHVEEGIDLPYDYEARGCAYTCHKMLKEALDTIPMQHREYPSSLKRTRREICYNYAHHDHPWNMLFMMIFIGADVDCQLSEEENIIIPEDLVSIWQNTKVYGEYLLSKEPHILVPSTIKYSRPWCTPIVVAVLILLLVIGNCYIKCSCIDWMVLGIVSLLGAFVTYLVLFSVLPCNHWNWLIIPFNILPIIFWKWRQIWAMWYVYLVGIWIIFILTWPYLLVDMPLLVLLGSFVIVLINSSYKYGKKN